MGIMKEEAEKLSRKELDFMLLQELRGVGQCIVYLDESVKKLVEALKHGR